MKGNHLPIHKKVQILNMLCEGSSMRSVSRVVGCSINTVTSLMVDVGRKCEVYQYMNLRNLPCKRIEVDEIWSFCYGKSKNVPKDKGGDIWTWTAIDSDTRLMIGWLAGHRELDDCRRFCRDLASRVTGRPQISSDGLNSYVQGLEAAFGGNVHYGQLVKNYNDDKLTLTKRAISGNPDMSQISTSLVERQNLTMRTNMRRYTRKTNGHSKKIENHRLALALYFMFYNFIRIHSTLRVTPAMEAKISDHVWSWEEVLEMKVTKC